MKTKLLKHEEDILFHAWTLTLFLLFSRTRYPTEVLSSRSNTYCCRSLSDDRRLFPALNKSYFCYSCIPNFRGEKKTFLKEILKWGGGVAIKWLWRGRDLTIFRNFLKLGGGNKRGQEFDFVKINISLENQN